MNLSPNTAGLRRGNTENVGRKPLEAKYRRGQMLSGMREFPSAAKPGNTLLDAAFEALDGLIAAGDGPTVRWFFDQQVGTPQTKQEILIEKSEQVTDVFRALWGVLCERGHEDLYVECVDRAMDELGQTNVTSDGAEVPYSQ